MLNGSIFLQCMQKRWHLTSISNILARKLKNKQKQMDNSFRKKFYNLTQVIDFLYEKIFES